MKRICRIRKNIFKNFRGGVLFLLFNISLIGVGFSSWVYTSIKNANHNINIEVGNIINLGEYFSEPEINTFEVCPTGLVVDETICYKGEISLKTNILLKNGLLSKLNNITETVNLSIKIVNKGTFNFFSNLYMGSLNPNIKYSFFEIGNSPNYLDASASINNYLIKTDISYSNSSLQTIESVSMSLIYYFDFSNYKDNFQKQIYDNLGNDPLSFDLNIEVI